MDVTLPPGYTARPLTVADAPAVADVIGAEEIVDLGRVDSDADDVVGDWQRLSFDLALSTIGVLDAGRLVAYGELDGDHSYGAVHPEHQRRGIGSWVADWLEDRARSADVGELGAQVFRGGAADRLLTSRGYRERWTAWDLVLPEGAEILAQPLPEGYALRDAGAADHEACWTVIEDALLEWSARERHPIEDFASRVWARPGFEPWNLRLVADSGGLVVGAVHVVLTGDTAYVARVAVRRDRRGLGLARAMLGDAFALGRSHGAVRSALSTDSRTGALGLYEKVGMVVDSEWVNRVITL